MIYAAIGFLALLVWGIKKAEAARTRRLTAEVEKAHRLAYELIDRCKEPEEAQAYKEYFDTWIHDYWENHLHVKYDPQGIDEVTSAAQRARIEKALATTPDLPDVSTKEDRIAWDAGAIGMDQMELKTLVSAWSARREEQK